MTNGTAHTSSDAVALVILAAGKGTRMKSQTPKVLHDIGNKAMIDHIIDNASCVKPDQTVVVIGLGHDQIKTHLGDRATVVIQDPPLGTGHAVKVTKETLGSFEGDVLVLLGDVPLMTSGIFAAMQDKRKGGMEFVFLGFRPVDPASYGRMVTDRDGRLCSIVEFVEADEETRAIGLCNSGFVLAPANKLYALLDEVKNDNNKGEYYLTDVAALAYSKGISSCVVEASEEEVMGVNSRSELALAEANFQARKRKSVMDNGATLLDPETVWFSCDTVIGKDVTIGQNVVFGPGVVVDSNVTIKAFCHLEQAHVSSGAVVGPYARLRPGAEIGPNAHIGNFVEIKKASIGEGAKVNHLTYVGDATVGARANLGAGTITCNYDGFDKHHTVIGADAFIGSNTSLVAPVIVADGGMTGSGSVITRDVSANSLAMTRSDQVEKPDWAARFRAAKNKRKKG